MKQTIEEAANNYTEGWSGEGDVFSKVEQTFIDGAMSPEAKTFHTQGMYSEEEVLKIIEALHNDWILGENGEVIEFLDWFEEYKKKRNGNS